jgi:hypothetical protein
MVEQRRFRQSRETGSPSSMFISRVPNLTHPLYFMIQGQLNV